MWKHCNEGNYNFPNFCNKFKNDKACTKNALACNTTISEYQKTKYKVNNRLLLT
jgi:hypothetical protein